MRVLRTAPLLALAATAVLAACGDSPTEPPKRADIGVELVHPVDYQYVYGDDGALLVSCDAYLRAVNHGSAAGSLGAVKIYLYAGKTRAVPLDSITIDDAAQAWDSPTLAPGDTTQSVWSLRVQVPIGLTMEFSTHDDRGATKGARVSFACGPVPPPSPPPVVRALALSMDPSNVPGATLVVDYEVTAPAGLWHTTIAADGPCHVESQVYDHAATDVTHQIRLAIPATCALGMPFTVTVSALDVGLEQGSASTVSSFVIEDHTPPAVSPTFWVNGSWSGSFGGTYFTGDTLLFDARATDNAGLWRLVWTVLPSGETDSVSLSGLGGAALPIAIPVPPSWNGTSQRLRLVVRDAGGNSTTIETPPAAFTIVGEAPRSVARTTLSGVLSDVAVDGRHARVYVLLAGKVVVLSAATLAPIDTIPISIRGAAIDLTAGGDTLVVAPYDMDSLAIVDVNAPRATRVHDVPVTIRPPGIGQGSAMITVGSDGKAYIIRLFADYEVMSHDLASGAEQRIDGAYYLLGRSLDHDVVTVQRSAGSCTMLYAVASATLSPCGPLEAAPSVGLWGDRTGARFAYGLAVWDVASSSVQRVTLPVSVTPAPVYGSALSPDGTSLFVGVRGHLVRARASDGALLDATRLPDGPYDIVRMAEDGSFIIGVTGTFGAITRVTLP